MRKIQVLAVLAASTALAFGNVAYAEVTAEDATDAVGELPADDGNTLIAYEDSGEVVEDPGVVEDGGFVEGEVTDTAIDEGTVEDVVVKDDLGEEVAVRDGDPLPYERTLDDGVDPDVIFYTMGGPAGEDVGGNAADEAAEAAADNAASKALDRVEVAATSRTSATVD